MARSFRLGFLFALLFGVSFAFSQAPICDVTCSPDPGGSGYGSTVEARTASQNARGAEGQILLLRGR